jgi:hypothetical protein
MKQSKYVTATGFTITLALALQLSCGYIPEENEIGPCSDFDGSVTHTGTYECARLSFSMKAPDDSTWEVTKCPGLTDATEGHREGVALVRFRKNVDSLLFKPSLNVVVALYDEDESDDCNAIASSAMDEYRKSWDDLEESIVDPQDNLGDQKACTFNFAVYDTIGGEKRRIAIKQSYLDRDDTEGRTYIVIFTTAHLSEGANPDPELDQIRNSILFK